MTALEPATLETNLTRVEEDIRRFWQWYRIAETADALRRGAASYRLIQQPIEVARCRWVDQVTLLVTADLLTRYQTMRGRDVVRAVGWSCHGLSVEQVVEEALQKEAGPYDLERFNAECRKVVADSLERATAWAERLGVWLAPASTYTTLEAQSVGAVWAGVRRLWDMGRLQQVEAVTPVCPRCGALLHVSQAARHTTEVQASAAWVRLPWDGEADTYFLAWTEAPWMLIGLVALAVHPGAGYLVVEKREHPDLPPMRFVVAESAAERMFQENCRTIRRLSGKALRGMRYRPLFTFVPSDQSPCRVVLSADVPLERGTGIWPVTPAFDALSHAIARQHHLSVPKLLDDWGTLSSSTAPWQGLVPMDAEPLLLEDLRGRGLVVQEQPVKRTQRYCPNCGERLLPLARALWQIRTDGGPWVIGRDRPWGVPLPIWVCNTCGKQVCVAGLDDLAHRTGQQVSDVEPHRPSVDRMTFPCDECVGTMLRISEVSDVAFETVLNALARSEEPGPAELAVGFNTKAGWLDLLQSMAGLMEGAPASNQSLALVNSQNDSSWDLTRPFLSDAVRWASVTGSTPDLVERDLLQPLWRVALALSASQTGDAADHGESELLHRWLRARIAKAVGVVTDGLDSRDLAQAVAELTCLLDDVVRLYLAYQPEGAGDVLDTLSRLLAPFVPHLAEAMHRLTTLRAGDSVLLARWPMAEAGRVDDGILAQLAGVGLLAELGETARRHSGIEPQRRLPKGIVGRLVQPSPHLATSSLEGLLARALNVNQVEVVEGLPFSAVWRLALSPDSAPQRSVAASDIDASLASLEADSATALVTQLRDGLSVTLEVTGRTVTLLREEVETSVEALPGWAAAGNAGWVVSLQIG